MTDIAEIIFKAGIAGVICIASVLLVSALVAYFSWRMRSDQTQNLATNLPDAVQVERRGHERADVILPASIETSEGIIHAQTGNISLGGAFIRYWNPLPLGEKFRLTITLPNSSSLTVNAEVVWSNANVPDSRIVNRGMGIRFVHITKDDREILSELVSAHLETTAE